MAEAHALEPVDGLLEAPVMPHIEYPQDMDRLHPPLRVPPGTDGNDEQQMDYNDPVFQHGLELARAIAETTMTQGRRRIERGG
jgi:hypothetical protein